MDFMTNIAESCMPFLRLLREISNPFFDVLFSLITHLGEETVFLVIAILIFWCIDKRAGYFVLLTGLLGTVMNQFLKVFFKVPRPWVIDHSFRDILVEDAIAEATGYSFPSGHTQNIAGTFGAIALYYKKKRPLLVISLSVIILVAFSRMYLGVHTPIDVCVSLILAVVLLFILYPVFKSRESFDRGFRYVVIVSAVVSAAYFVYVLSLSGDTALDSENYASAMKNASTLLGCTVGLLLVYFVDSRYLHFETSAVWYAQIIKLCLGLLVVLGIKSGLSTPLTLLFGNELIARSVRYFLVVAFAGAVYPLSFKYFARLRIPALDDFGRKVCAMLSKKR